MYPFSTCILGHFNFKVFVSLARTLDKLKLHKYKTIIISDIMYVKSKIMTDYLLLLT